MLCHGAIVDIARRAGKKELQMYEDYTTAPDGTYVEAQGGLFRVEANHGYWVGLKAGVTRAGRKAEFIGIWSARDGEQFVDPVRWVATLDKALHLATIHEQIAIWDCKEGREIYV